MPKHVFHYSLKNIEKTSRMGKALSSPIRLQILSLLINQSMTMTELSQLLYVSLSSISMHVKVLEEEGLITVTPKPGMHGAQKVCGIRAEKVVFDFFGMLGHEEIESSHIMDIPIGSYAIAKITQPCGIVDSKGYIGKEDTPFVFYDPSHISAQLIWFTSGYLEYHISNKYLINQKVKRLNINFEVCAEAPGYNNNWPSDIYIQINDMTLCGFRVKGDYGGKRGINNPSWWSNSNTQYGELKILSITDEGTSLDGKIVSKENLQTLKLMDGYYFKFKIGVDSSSECAGGINLFGKSFGNYAQDIRIQIEYS